MAVQPTFIDLKERNDRVREELERQKLLLQRRGDRSNNNSASGRNLKLPPTWLSDDELAEFKRLTKLTEKVKGAYKVEVVDPLFLATREILGRSNKPIDGVADHKDGSLGALSEAERTLVGVYGLLAAGNVRVEQPHGLPVDKRWDGSRPFIVDDPAFATAVSVALGNYSNRKTLFEKTLDIITSRAVSGNVRAEQWAAVTTVLINRGVSADDAFIELQTNEALSGQVGAGDGAAPSSIELLLPDLEATSDVEIIKNNILSMHIFYPSWMLDEAKFFDTYDKVEELFLNQMLPLGRGGAGDKIYKRWKTSNQRISKGERLNFYASCFGAPGGTPTLTSTNREFSDLWMRFVSAVSEFSRKLTVDDFLRSRFPLSVSAEQVRKSGRDLAANLSLHGYGIAYFAATELQAEINDIIGILNDPEVRGAYGARDLWQLIEQVSIYELGGARNTVRYRTMATAGAVIIRWLADHAQQLSGAYQTTILDPDVILKPSLRPGGVRATEQPTDRDLVDACEQWLAVTGTTDERVSEFSQPTEGPAMTSRPVQIPQVAKDLLDSVGVTAGYGGDGRYSGNGGVKPPRRLGV